MCRGSIIVAMAALLALPVAAGATPVPTSVGKRVGVKSTGVTTVTATCPSKTLAMSGYVTSVSDGAFASDSVPVDLRRWTFRFTSSSGEAESARVALRCLRVKAPPGVRRVQTKIFTARRDLRLPGDTSFAVRARCGRGFVPTGYGVDRSAAGAEASRLLLASAVPGRSSWAFRVENTSDTELRPTIRLRCVATRATGKRAGESSSERFSVRRVGFTDRVGSESLSHRCPSGTYALAAGHKVPVGDDISVPGSHPAGPRTGRWSFLNPSGAGVQARTYLSCLSLRTKFR